MALTIWSSWAYHLHGPLRVSGSPTRWFTEREGGSPLSNFGSLDKRHHVEPRFAKLAPRALELMSMRTPSGFPWQEKIRRAC
jgi:hypothetical protein